jgi:Pyridoxamine 5'-phosphate oxidase
MPITLGMYAPNKGVKRWGFAEQAKKLRIASAAADGTINISPAWFVVVDETVYIALDPDVGDPIHSSTPDATHIQTIQGGGRVSVIIDEGDELNNVVAVQIAGRGEIVEDESLIELLHDLAAEKYFYVGHPHLEHYFSPGMVSSRRWCRLVEEEIDGWDMRVLLQPPVQDHLPFPEHMLGDD